MTISSTVAFQGSRSAPKPPERGSFPLDRRGQCKEVAEAYMKCMKENEWHVEACRSISKAYLSCRMERNLMAPAEWERLGFQEERKPQTVEEKSGNRDEQKPTESTN